jgi:hypothetical protein
MLSNLNKGMLIPFRAALLSVMLLITNTAFAQLVPISLAERVENSTLIFEGKVISQEAYWDDNRQAIYTSSVIEIYKLFKGQLITNKVEIINRGGIVGDRMERVSHTLELNIGDVGVFTAIPTNIKLTTKPNLTQLRPFAGIQGFIKYDLKAGSGKDVFNEYKNISTDVYIKIANQTKIDFKTVQKAPFKFDQQ